MIQISLLLQGFQGFPITFLEACICGKPLVTTTNGDELDWINGRVGYITNYDIRQLNDAILHVLVDDELRHNFGDEGKRIVDELFNWKILTENIANIYIDCINTHFMNKRDYSP